MFRTVPLSIISSFSLYAQQWYMSYRFADSCHQTCMYWQYGQKFFTCYSNVWLARFLHTQSCWI